MPAQEEPIEDIEVEEDDRDEVMKSVSPPLVADLNGNAKEPNFLCEGVLIPVSHSILTDNADFFTRLCGESSSLNEDEIFVDAVGITTLKNIIICFSQENLQALEDEDIVNLINVGYNYGNTHIIACVKTYLASQPYLEDELCVDLLNHTQDLGIPDIFRFCFIHLVRKYTQKVGKLFMNKTPIEFDERGRPEKLTFFNKSVEDYTLYFLVDDDYILEHNALYVPQGTKKSIEIKKRRWDSEIASTLCILYMTPGENRRFFHTDVCIIPQPETNPGIGMRDLVLQRGPVPMYSTRVELYEYVDAEVKNEKLYVFAQQGYPPFQVQAVPLFIHAFFQQMKFGTQETLIDFAVRMLDFAKQGKVDDIVEVCELYLCKNINFLTYLPLFEFADVNGLGYLMHHLGLAYGRMYDVENDEYHRQTYENLYFYPLKSGRQCPYLNCSPP